MYTMGDGIHYEMRWVIANFTDRHFGVFPNRMAKPSHVGPGYASESIHRQPGQF
jgi:hypothetical protein